MSEPKSAPDRRELLARALRRYRARLARKLEALRGDLEFARRAPEFRRSGEALLAYLHQVTARAAVVELPDPSDGARTLKIELDPGIKPQANAARYFKRAAKAERGLTEVPPRLANVEKELVALDTLLAREPNGDEEIEALDRDLEEAFAKLGPGVRSAVAPGLEARRGAAALARSKPADAKPSAAAVARGDERAPSARLQPRRLKSREGWDVLIGRNNEGNDYLTHHLARPEDYWFHVQGASGSHVVLRRGKGKNEPSKQTIEEVASWAAFYSQARTAGKVPVVVTRKKYVRKPRKAPAGLAVCEREKTVMVRPVKPDDPKDQAKDGDHDDPEA